MTYEEAYDNVLERFSELPDKKQLPYVLQVIEENVVIFETDKFNKFCEKEFKNDYLKLVDAIQNTIDYQTDFYQDDLWCLYDKDNNIFRTTNNTPVDFIDDEDALFEILINFDSLLDLNYDEDEIIEILNTYNSYQESEN